MQPYTTLVVDLGAENEGAFGPDSEVNANYDGFVAEVAKPEYKRKPTGNWVCVDGREPEEGAVDDGEFADGQIAGSLPITNTAGDLMDDTKTDVKLSERVAANTREAVADKHKVTVHGDDHAEEEGCAANKKMRDTLAKIGANGDIIAPRAWALCEATGLTEADEDGEPLLVQDDVTRAIVTAGERAEDDSVWDVTPAQVIEIAVANGAQYQRLKGSHQERAVAAPLKGTYATQKFAQDHPTADGEGRHELFGMSAGEYVKTTIEDTVNRGGSRREGARKAMRGIVYNLGLCKKIGKKGDGAEQGLNAIVLAEAELQAA